MSHGSSGSKSLDDFLDRLNDLPKPWQHAIGYGCAFLFYAAFPRITYLLRWPSRLGPRGPIGYVAYKTAVGVVVRGWLVSGMKRKGEEMERAREQLERRLGRTPTGEELMEHLRKG